MTKICVTASAPDLEAPIDPRFGRCAYFIFANSDTMEFEAIPNEGISVSGGAGVKAAQTVSDKGVEVVITGRVGPNAYPALENAGIKIMLCSTGSVHSAINLYRQGSLELIKTAGPAHMGMGRGIGRGGGRRERGGW